MKTVQVLFDGGYKNYSYLCHDNSVQVGDWALVMTPRNIPAVVVVQDVSDVIGSKATKAIIKLLNKDHLYIDDTEAQIRCIRYLDAKKKLDEKLVKFKEIGQYQLLALQDPEAAELLKILKG